VSGNSLESVFFALYLAWAWGLHAEGADLLYWHPRGICMALFETSIFTICDSHV
jgi:hypothetical protein